MPRGILTVLAPSPKPPPEHRSTMAVNGGLRRSTTAVNVGQPWRTTVDHRRTTTGPPPDHRSTVFDRQSMDGSTVRSGFRLGLNSSQVGLPRVTNLVVPRGTRFIILAPGKLGDRT
ncbi:hypothetical protein Tco_0170771 [Tanacetum coccineum]